MSSLLQLQLQANSQKSTGNLFVYYVYTEKCLQNIQYRVSNTNIYILICNNTNPFKSDHLHDQDHLVIYGSRESVTW